MKTSPLCWLLYLALIVLYLLHNDLWLWDNPQLVFGLPVGLVYHIGFCIVAAVLMRLLVFFAWPSHLQIEDNEESER